MLSISNIHVSSNGKEIIHGVSFTIGQGEIIALMGPNGSGKSTLAYALMGHPRYEITSGSITFCGKDLLELDPEDRAKAGMFLSFQYPQEIAGVPFGKFLRQAREETTQKKHTVKDFLRHLNEKREMLGIEKDFIERSVNEGFSGGEKKRAEILQLSVLEPRLAILDETDSGLDVDALRTVAEGLKRIMSERPDMGVLLITHYERFLEFLVPDRVLVMKDGRIVAEGTHELANQIQQEGYEKGKI